ncbi:MAG: ribose-phosphate diphosphokinase [Candidatus Nealsonbacteria bacterium]|nr:ribose-phosphate diphosphokinase [Candidatus Nealsonbacteria bacterium]
MVYLIPTSTTEHLIEGIKARENKLRIIFPEKNREGRGCFPDGEIYMKISRAGRIKKKRVIVLHSGSPKPNQGLIELELILQILRDNSIKPEVFFTYFPYGMQDKVFEKGETNVAENLIEKLVNYYRVKKIYIIDPHFGGQKWVKKYPIKSISLAPLLIKRTEKDIGKDILFLSPDEGGVRRTGFSGIKKERLDSFRVKYFSPKLRLKRKTIGVVDDIIETGGTVLSFYNILKKAGAEKVILLASHGVLPSGISRVKKKFFKTYLANTIKQKSANVDITDLVLKVMLNQE